MKLTPSIKVEVVFSMSLDGTDNVVEVGRVPLAQFCKLFEGSMKSYVKVHEGGGVEIEEFENATRSPIVSVGHVVAERNRELDKGIV